MKHNLGNRPRKKDHYVEEYWRLAEEWFENFEKELQQLFSRAPRAMKYANAQQYINALELFIQKVEDEILGEN